MERVRWLASAALVVTILCGGAEPARAQDDPRKAEAEALYQEGLKLHDKDREAEALEKFQRSYALYPSPNTLVGVARAEQLVGRPLDAIRHYREALKQPLLNPKWATLARQYVAELEGKLARVFVSGPSGTKVTVGTVTVRLPMEEPLDVDAGALTVRGEHEGVALSGTGQAAPGKVTTIELKSEGGTPPGAGGSGAAAAELPSVPPVEPTSSWTTGKTIGVSLWGGAVVAAGIGVGYLLAASAASSDLDAARASQSGASDSCVGITSPECARREELADDKASFTTAWRVAFISAGGLALAGGAFFFFWPKSTTTKASIAPWLSAEAGGVTMKGSF